MASLVGVKLSSNKKKVELKISMNYSEYLMLRGSATNVRVFSEDTPSFNTKIRTAGKKGETKYLLVPKEIRKKVKHNNHVTYQLRDFPDRYTILYVIDKGD